MLQYESFHDVVYQFTFNYSAPKSFFFLGITLFAPAQRCWKYTCLHDLSGPNTQCFLVVTFT
jgi:hypothetical protein